MTLDNKKIKGISLKILIIIMGTIGVIISGILIASLYWLNNKFNAMKESEANYIEWEQSANILRRGSDSLTENVRAFAITGSDEYIKAYFKEAFEDKSRDNAILNLKNQSVNTSAYEELVSALSESNQLMNIEYKSMYLITLAYHIDIETYENSIITEKLSSVHLTDAEEAYSDEEKIDAAREMLYDYIYLGYKERIYSKIDLSIKQLDTVLKQNLSDATSSLKDILIVQQSLIMILLIFLVSLFVILFINLVRPLNRGTSKIIEGDELEVKGVVEYKYLASSYNEMLDSNKEMTEILMYEADHDKLTSTYNRTGYDKIYRSLDLTKTTFILLDIDAFKKFNDLYGHSVGDEVLTFVSSVLLKHFKNTDYVCRLGGDEFCILLSNCGVEQKDSIAKRLDEIKNELGTNHGQLPKVTLSIGIAFGVEEDNTETLFKKADRALYSVKKNGKNGYLFYDPSEIDD